MTLNLPSVFINNVTQAFAPQGEKWLAELPRRLAEAAHRWGLTLGEPFELSYNYVCATTRADGTPAVLKVGVPNRELTSEMAALRLYDGQGACRLYESEPKAGMMLIERLTPGTMLSNTGTDEEQTAIAAQVMKRLWRPVPEKNEGFISLKGWFDELRKLRPRFGGGTGPFPPRLVEAVEYLLPDLLAESADPVILHGDCHHFNILLSQRGWLVIDPKGVIGPAEYEPAPLLINPLGELTKFPDAVQMTEKRIRILGEVLGLDPKRLRAWAICHSLLSAWWDMQEDLTGGEYSSACGEIFLKARIKG